AVLLRGVVRQLDNDRARAGCRWVAPAARGTGLPASAACRRVCTTVRLRAALRRAALPLADRNALAGPSVARLQPAHRAAGAGAVRTAAHRGRRRAAPRNRRRGGTPAAQPVAPATHAHRRGTHAQPQRAFAAPATHREW